MTMPSYLHFITPSPGETLAEEIARLYGDKALDLVLTVYVNFFYSELEIIDLCGKWVPRRLLLKEKAFLLKQALDEVVHSRLFQEGIEHLGLSWRGLDHARYRIPDIGARFDALFDSQDEIEVLIGLNLYAEGVLAMEELEQLGRNKPRYFPRFGRILRDELTHLAFGRTVALRLIQQSEDARTRAQSYCDRYAHHLRTYLGGALAEFIHTAKRCGFVDPSFEASTFHRYGTVMGQLGLRVPTTSSSICPLVPYGSDGGT